VSCARLNQPAECFLLCVNKSQEITREIIRGGREMHQSIDNDPSQKQKKNIPLSFYFLGVCVCVSCPTNSSTCQQSRSTTHTHSTRYTQTRIYSADVVGKVLPSW
jgi:hypothetical protein